MVPKPITEFAHVAFFAKCSSLDLCNVGELGVEAPLAVRGLRVPPAYVVKVASAMDCTKTSDPKKTTSAKRTRVGFVVRVQPEISYSNPLCHTMSIPVRCLPLLALGRLLRPSGSRGSRGSAGLNRRSSEARVANW